MRIMLGISELPPVKGGVALCGSKLREGYQKMGHSVEVVTMRGLPKLIVGEVRISSLILKWPGIRRRLENCDWLHLVGPAPTFSDLFLLLARLSVKGRKRPVLLYTQNFELDLPRLRWPCSLYNNVHSRILGLADHVVVPTHAYEHLLLCRGHRRVAVIPWGADHRLSLPPRRAEGRFQVLFVGQARPYKGVEVLLRAFQKVPGARLSIIGEGPCRARYEALARSLGLRHIEFHGEVSDQELPLLFARAQVIVLPSVSRMEAFGIALLEGMMAGCVPVASDLPGIAEVIGDAGILVPTGDSERLAEALCRLKDDRGLLEELSRRAQERAKLFRWEETIQKYLDLFEQLSQTRLTAV